MITPTPEATLAGARPEMTPERWRAIDAILKAALDREPRHRAIFIADACGGDEALRREVASLLAAHDGIGEEFLERPAAEALGASIEPQPLAERLASALAGRYAIEREVAHGGMATVFLARDLRHDRRVAIKVLREELAAALGAERFLAEIRVTASLQHPHILPLFDSGSVPARHPHREQSQAEGPSLLYYVMPFVEGETLRSRLDREKRLPVPVAVQLAREMAEALDHAHHHGVVHRDVKPENVLLQGEHALVADFGIALALQHAGGERLTRTGLTIGTPQYMAPEQAAGERTIDARADVYALGVVLHEMLAGESPFAAASQHAVLQRVLNERASALVTRRADTPPFVDAAVQRALAKHPDDRFPTAAAFAAALVAPRGDAAFGFGSLGGELPDASRDDRPEPVQPARARGRTVSARAAMYAALALLIVGLVGGWALARSSWSERWSSPSAPPWRPPTGATLDRAPAGASDLTLTVVDRAGRAQRSIPANRPWTPRFSPDGRRVAYGAFGDGRNTSDLWVTNLDAGTTQRLTDDDGDSNDPQWSADGSTIAYSVGAAGGKDLVSRRPGGEARVLAAREGIQYASDWLRDGSALLVTEETATNGRDIIVQPADGSTARRYAATPANETAARVSPDGRWIAYTSDGSGQPEVYLDSYQWPGRRVTVSSGGGAHPVWRGDGRELYYWSNGALVAVQLGSATGGAPPAIGTRTVLFRAAYPVEPNTMYDVSPDGQRFVIVQHR
jgi:serine/threonine-protein kinase